MKRAPVLFFLACLLAGCDRPQVPSVDVLAADPAGLHALRAQCDGGKHDGALCAQVAQADLPPIPASFDTSTTSQEDRP